MKCFLVSFLSILASVSSSNFDCELCSDQEYNSCPYVEPSSTCQVVSEPNCGCCYMCAKKVGEACGTAVGQCEENLECLPPPETALFRNDDDSTLNKICYRKSGRKRATINLLRAVAKGAVKVKSKLSFIDKYFGAIWGQSFLLSTKAKRLRKNLYHGKI